MDTNAVFGAFIWMNKSIILTFFALKDKSPRLNDDFSE